MSTVPATIAPELIAVPRWSWQRSLQQALVAGAVLWLYSVSLGRGGGGGGE